MSQAAALKSPRPYSPTPAPGAAASSRFSFAMLSHPGRVRHVNQDACAALPERAAFVVCDGVGGAAGGEVASHLAVEAFLNALSRSEAASTPSSKTRPAANSDSDSEDPHHPHARLHEAVRSANRAVFERAQKSRSLRGMATTLVAALLDPVAGSLDPTAALLDHTTALPNGVTTPQQAAPECLTLWLTHVGDSRCYRLRRDGDVAALTLLTRDHSLVEEQVRAGLLSRVQAECSPVRNVITRAVGSVDTVEPEIAAHPIQPGDLYLLASDGLTRELNDDAIARLLTDSLARTPTTAHSSPSPVSPSASLEPAALDAAAHALIDAANAHGGRDNITVLLIACR